MSAPPASPSRREFLSASVAIGISAVASGSGDAQDRHALPHVERADSRDWSKIRGFNYQPSYGRSGTEIWTRFDTELIANELARGKRYFQHINTLRIWLSWESFHLDPKSFAANLESMLQLIDGQGWKAMPILFNRWRGYPEFGGIYMDHFMPGSIIRDEDKETLDSYLEATVGRYNSDARVLIWDLCNEPYFNRSALGQPDNTPPAVAEAETRWLRDIHRKAKSLKPIQPLTIAAHGKHPLSRFNEFSDVLTVHPYWMPGLDSYSLDDFIRGVDSHLVYAQSVKKPLFASECCLGRADDSERVTIIRGTLEILQSRKIGWLPHLLHHSLVADAHRSQFGAYSGLYLAFIEADGSLRAGHDVFNDYGSPAGL